ncbi:hypothetical protein Vafri_18820 [Volvox africanus]|uniref:Uncharacterized protein n=1 Tax=Volvox africanus TaxID=51714 RepID=A0A8J4F8S4_9CHLO|nr:hypothetical protein Vafri_18820 [Volvox africanus]
MAWNFNTHEGDGYSGELPLWWSLEILGFPTAVELGEAHSSILRTLLSQNNFHNTVDVQVKATTLRCLRRLRDQASVPEPGAEAGTELGATRSTDLPRWARSPLALRHHDTEAHVHVEEGQPTAPTSRMWDRGHSPG